MGETFRELLEARSAYRAIDPRPVEKERLQAMLEAAQLSASCMNMQPWRFLVLDEGEALETGKELLLQSIRGAGSQLVVRKVASQFFLDEEPAPVQP